MTLDEFLCWEDGTDTRYELIDGVPSSIPLSFEAQRILATRLGVTIERALSHRRPCNAQFSAGITPPASKDCYFVADIAATCARTDARRQVTEHPFLIIEVTSPGIERHDRRIKMPAYHQIDSVEEILLVASDDIYVEVHRRFGAQWFVEILNDSDAEITLALVPLRMRLADLYEDIALAVT